MKSRIHLLTIIGLGVWMFFMTFSKLTVFYFVYNFQWINFTHSQGLHNATIHCSDVIMSSMASKITSLSIVYSTIHSGADQSKHQSSASLAFVRGIHRWPVNFPHKGPVTRKMFRYDEVTIDTSKYMHSGNYSNNTEPCHDSVAN